MPQKEGAIPHPWFLPHSPRLYCLSRPSSTTNLKTSVSLLSIIAPIMRREICTKPTERYCANSHDPTRPAISIGPPLTTDLAPVLLRLYHTSHQALKLVIANALCLPWHRVTSHGFMHMASRLALELLFLSSPYGVHTIDSQLHTTAPTGNAVDTIRSCFVFMCATLYFLSACTPLSQGSFTD